MIYEALATPLIQLSTLQTQGSLRLPEAQGPDARENALFDPPPVDFVFRRFLAYMALSMTFRANSGTTRPPTSGARAGLDLTD